jgi:hypothetical protein
LVSAQQDVSGDEPLIPRFLECLSGSKAFGQVWKI